MATTPSNGVGLTGNSLLNADPPRCDNIEDLVEALCSSAARRACLKVFEHQEGSNIEKYRLRQSLRTAGSARTSAA